MAIWQEDTHLSAMSTRWKCMVLRTSSTVEPSKKGKVPPVSDSTLTKPPSAELAPDQRDDDTLPPYTVLDSILKHHIEDGLGADEIAAKGHDRGYCRYGAKTTRGQ